MLLLVVLLVLVHEYSRAGCVRVLDCAGYPWISLDIECVDIHGYPV